MTAAIIVLVVLMILWVGAAVNCERDDDQDGSTAFLFLAAGCFIAIGVLGAVLAWRYLP